jgi:hypothetical protein
MPNFNNSEIASVLDVVPPFKGRVDEAYQPGAYGVPSLQVDDPSAYATAQPTPQGFNDDGQQTPIVGVNFNNARVQEAVGIDWWERFHVIPRSVELGQILSTQQVPFEVYSAYRRTFNDWTSFINGAGDGTELLGLPTLPYTFGPQSSGDLTLILEVSTSGAASVDDTLDFGFDGPQTSEIPITLSRVVLFFVDPQMPYEESLEFYTDIQNRKDGSEKRDSPRKNPRQLFEWDFILEDGTERTRVHNLLFDWQSRVFGIPIWHEATRLTADASISDLTITVDSTAYADYRTTGSDLVLIYESQTKFDVLPLASLTATTLTLESGLLNDYAVSDNVIVMPLRTGKVANTIQGSRFPSADARMKIRFRVDDNDTDIADTSAFSSYNSKVLLDDCNGLRSSMGETFQHDVIVLDNETGLVFTDTSWDQHKRLHRKVFYTNSKQTLWETRQLIHALRGRQVSFYIPSFSNDLQADQDLTMGSALLSIENVGYAQYVRQRFGRQHIRVTFLNGDPPLLREILSSSEVSATRESLTLDAVWPSTVALADIDEIQFVELVRFNTDRIRFNYQTGGHTVKVFAPVKAVFE